MSELKRRVSGIPVIVENTYGAWTIGYNFSYTKEHDIIASSKNITVFVQDTTSFMAEFGIVKPERLYYPSDNFVSKDFTVYCNGTKYIFKQVLSFKREGEQVTVECQEFETETFK